MDRNTFLTLLTTQLQNQDPTSPMDNQEFVAQLAQFTSLEQMVSMNGTMQSMVMGIASMNNATMASLVGTDVVALGNGLEYDGESKSVELHYESAAKVTEGTLTVYDEDGTMVYTRDTGSLEAEEGFLTWDGTTNSGGRAEAGTYTFEITGTDVNGDDVEVVEHIVGTITEMDYTSGVPRPSVGGYSFGIGDILRLTAGTNDGNADADGDKE
jgi:flagellar basal-body rod modification protein FlgD